MTHQFPVTRYCALCSWSHTSRTTEENDAMLKAHTVSEHCLPLGAVPHTVTVEGRVFIPSTFHCDRCDWEIDPRAPGSAGALGRHMWDAHDGFDARLTDEGRRVLKSLSISAE